MPIVLLGNHSALDNGEPLEGEQVTTVIIPDTDTHSEGFRTITHNDGVWARVASEDAVWVASDSERMAIALGAHFGCPVISLEEAYEHRDAANRVADALETETGITDEDVEQLLGSGSEDAAPGEGELR